jgi:hypothetical protein
METARFVWAADLLLLGSGFITVARVDLLGTPFGGFFSRADNLTPPSAGKSWAERLETQGEPKP